MRNTLIKIQAVVILIFGFILLSAGQCASCPIPVFRYALEYWETDPYILEIIYENSLLPEEEELVTYLPGASSGRNGRANIHVIKTDAAGNFESYTRGYLNHQTKEPVMVLRYPRISGNNRVIWSGLLNKVNIEKLLQSPVRENIGQKLAGEATAVWIFLESGNRRKDRDALGILEKELKRMEQTLVLPDRQLWMGPNGEVPEIKFEIVRLSRDNPHEEQLVKMLLNSEDDLTEFDDEPMVFPVFGRGIALYGIVGKGINEWNIRDAAEFLTGPCSCQAKLLNPGVDLLMSMDWDKVVEHVSDISIANPLSGMGDFSNREEEARRLLESATARRFGSEIRRSETKRVTDPEKVVVLNIFGHAGTEQEEEKKEVDGKPAENIKIPQVIESKPDREAVSAAVPEVEEAPEIKQPEIQRAAEKETVLQNVPKLEETQKSVVDRNGGKKDFTILLLVFGGIVLLVFLGGLIWFLKISKK